jgi:hypothetical protein
MILVRTALRDTDESLTGIATRVGDLSDTHRTEPGPIPARRKERETPPLARAAAGKRRAQNGDVIPV